ncbi:MAG: rhamnan synthesis F family protein, partial [Cyanobium sp.]
MAAFTIVTIEPVGYIHVRAFDEIRVLLYYSLLELGHSVSLRTNSFADGGIPIVLGAHLLPDNRLPELPQDAIIFNTEQLSGQYTTWCDRIVWLAKRHRVWDYSSVNIEFLHSRIDDAGERFQRLRLGYHEKLEKIERKPSRHAEFVFFGSLSSYRKTLLDSLGDSETLKIKVYAGIYGLSRNLILSKCKAALNMHSQESRILEWPRLIHLIANRVPCIALLHPLTRSEDEQLSYLLPCPEQGAITRLERYFDQPDQLEEHADQAWQRFRQERQADYIESTLDCSISKAELAASKPASYPWRATIKAAPIDPIWYSNVYPSIESDPRDIETYHQQEGCFRQYHPSAAAVQNGFFRPPLCLPAGRDELGGLATGKVMVGLRCAVVLHFYEPASAKYFFAQFGRHLVEADFLITVSNPVVAVLVEELANRLGITALEIELIENLGRDIPSKYMVFNRRLQQYDLCLFSHGKQSDCAWFYDHNKLLAGSGQRISAICQMFADNASLGIVFPEYLESHLIWVGWGGMRPIVDDL